MSTETKALSVAVACLQLNSSQSVVDNLHTVLRLAKAAIRQNKAQLIVLPENAFCHPYDPQQQTELNQVIPQLQQFASKHKVWFFAGTIPVPVNDGSGRVYSALHVINDRGEMIAVYRKLHLFDVHVADEGVDYRESDTFAPGDEVVVVETPWGNVGLAICYDLRFPELFLAMEQYQPLAFIVPSAFTLHTGRKHWHTLIRARAVDSFTWLLAADQTGIHANGRTTFGHSAIVDPDGMIVAERPEGEGCVCFTINSSAVTHLRRNLPLAMHRYIKRSAGGNFSVSFYRAGESKTV